MVDGGIRARYLCATQTSCHPTYAMCKPPTTLQTRSLRIMRQSQEKEKSPTTELKLSSREILSKEDNKYDY